jgi:Ca-activated chloride channel family protein
VTDSKGNYVTGLRPSDFIVSEDGIPQQLATFEAGNEGSRDQTSTAQGNSTDIPALPDANKIDSPKAGSPSDSPHENLVNGLAAVMTDANVFILFDTSNYMYKGRGFVFAQDAISDFVRSLDSPYRVAFYSYSRNFYRAASLTFDRAQVLRGVRATVNGADSALYNALLMTLKDAAQYSGKKVAVVFSNGPDNSSMIAPEDVDELAQSAGIPIYMISTREAKLDPATAAVFDRMGNSTGGKVYYAKTWRDERKAFASIRDDLAHLYFLSYYPQPNPNRGWRTISVKLAGPNSKKYHIRTRSGYRPIPAHIAVDTAAPVQ